MTDGYLMDADCVHGVVWYECPDCPLPCPECGQTGGPGPTPGSFSGCPTCGWCA